MNETATTTTILNEEKDLFLQTMDQLLTDRLTKVERTTLSNKKDSIMMINSGQSSQKHVNSLSPFKNIRLSRDSPSIFNQTQQIKPQNQSLSTLRQGLQRPQHAQDSNKRKQSHETQKQQQQQQQLLNKTQNHLSTQQSRLITEPQSKGIRSPIVELNSNAQSNSQTSNSQTNSLPKAQKQISTSKDQESQSQTIDEDLQEDEKLELDTFIEDTFISNMQKLVKLKKKLIECTKEYRQYTFTHSPRRQHSRIIDSLGLNPLDKVPKRRPRISKDPNLVYLDIDCSDKYGGARDIIEVKVNRSPPLLLNTRIQTHYELQYSNYTGLLNSLTERSAGLTKSQIMLNKLNYQISTQNALRSLQKDGLNKLFKKSPQPKHMTEQQKHQSPLIKASQSYMEPSTQHHGLSQLTPNFQDKKFSFQEGSQGQSALLDGGNSQTTQSNTLLQAKLQSFSQMLPQLNSQSIILDSQQQQNMNSNSTVQHSISNILTLEREDFLQQQNINSNPSINNDKLPQGEMFDFGFTDSNKSYLQTLEEFSQKLSQYDRYKPKGQEQGNFYDIQSEILNKAYKIDQGYSLIDYSNLQKLLLELLPNYRECLMRLVKIMPVNGCVMHQMMSFLMYQLDRTTRVFMSKEKNYLDALTKLEDQNKHLKQQLNATKEITQGYQKLESDYHNLSERYSKRIEQSQEVAEILSKDIFDLQYNFRNTSNLQIDSQDELQKKLEIIIKQFTMDREQNSFRIGELKTFLDKNISMLKNNWDDKREKETQTNFEDIISEIYGIDVVPTIALGLNNASGSGLQALNQSLQNINDISRVGGEDSLGSDNKRQVNLWDIVNQFIDQNKMKQKFEIGNELVTYKECLQTTEDIIRYGLKYKEGKEFPKYQQILMDYFLDQSDNTSLDYMRQATTKLANYTLTLNHFNLKGGLAVSSTTSKYQFQFKSQFEILNIPNLKTIDLSFVHQLLEDYMISLSYSLKQKKLFNELFPVGDVYENRDRQSEGYQISKDRNGFDPLQIQHLFQRVLQKDILDDKIREQSVQNIQKLQFLQMLQNQIVLTQETQDSPLSEVPAHMKAIFLIIAQIDFNNETVLDKRLWLMTLVKKLIEKDKSTCFSYDNLIGNFKDGQIGKKIKSQIFQEFFEKCNPERDFYESFYSQQDAIFQDNIVDTQFNMLSTQPVPVHTKTAQTPGGRQGGGGIGKLWRKDTTRAREALSRIVKRISIIKRLTVIRKVNEVIDKVCDDSSNNNAQSDRDNGNETQRVSFKKVVKILNLCHIYIPLVQVKANNSTDLSLDIKDMIQLSQDKERYKRFVWLQTESLEQIVKGFNIPVTVNNLFLLLTRFIIDKNHYYLSPLEVSCVLTECYHSHIQLRELYLKNMFYEKMKTDYSGLVRPQLESFLFEEMGIDNLNESHKVLYKVMMTKLKSKLDSPGVITKAIVNEQKVIYKYKDIEDEIIRRIATEGVMHRINSTEIMRHVTSTAQKIRDGKIVTKLKSGINTNGIKKKK